MATEAEEVSPLMKSEVSQLNNKMDIIENKLDKLLDAFTNINLTVQELSKDIREIKKTANEAWESSNKNNKEIVEFQEQVADLEQKLSHAVDRQRRKNLRLKGFPSNIHASELIETLAAWWKDYGIDLLPDDIERAHRSLGYYKQKQTTNKYTPDVIILFLREKTKDFVFKKLRAVHNLEYKGTKVQIVPDLSNETRKQRYQLQPVTTSLMEAGQKFTWGFPTAILVFKNGELFKARNLAEGQKMLEQLGIKHQNGKEPTSDQAEEEAEEEGPDNELEKSVKEYRRRGKERKAKKRK